MGVCAAAVAVAVAGTCRTAIAVVVDFGGYVGPIDVKLTNFDVGTIYANQAPGTTVTGAANLAALPNTPPPGVPVGSGESSWGIFQIKTIESADGTKTFYSYNSGINQPDLLGIFWGEIDDKITFVSPTEQDISGVGLRAAVYSVAHNSFGAAIAAGPLARGGTELAPTFPGITVGSPFWTFDSVPGANIGRSVTDTFFTQFDPTTDLILGQGSAYADAAVLPGGAVGTDNFQWVKNPTGDANFPHDVSFQFTSVTPNAGSAAGWLVQSQDPILGAVVPEPASVALLALGAAGLLMRRRYA